MDPTRQCETTPRGKVVILEADYFRWALYGMNDGEHIWAKSVLKAFDELGYTVLVSESARETNELYARLSGAVVLVIKTRDEMEKCVESSRKGKLGGCLEGERNTRGIPVWKIMAMYFFPNPGHPLGTSWTLSPEPYHEAGALGSDARYLGYSIEDACLSVPVVPVEERENRAYILAKYHNYFTSSETTWSLDSFPRMSSSLSTTFVGGWVDRGNPHQASPVEGVTNLGKMDREAFVREMAKSKVLIGMGNPVISPTPYEALCLAVPFINPIRDWNRDDPDNRDTWLSQHNGLHELSPPYVYHVHQHDEEGLTAAVQAALVSPIERYVLPRMRQDEVKERVRKMVEDVDWWKRWRELGDEGRKFKPN
ncbi:hypothetical protein BDY24DRAFT_338147 [Mrakia frigida]|uniref:uncharacterized protein n=1 Tax=Mrakia frigida TaxID=29902 RepID=UPI003FCC074D